MRKQLRRNVYRYTAVFEPAPEDGGVTVTIPALPGCISEGNTFEQAMDNIKDAATLYLQVMKKRHGAIADSEEGFIVAPVQIAV